MKKKVAVEIEPLIHNAYSIMAIRTGRKKKDIMEEILSKNISPEYLKEALLNKKAEIHEFDSNHREKMQSYMLFYGPIHKLLEEIRRELFP